MDICLNYSLIVSSSKDNKCIIWDTNKERIIKIINGFEFNVSHIKINRFNGNICCCFSNQMKLYSINGKILANLKLDHLHHDKITSLLIVKCDHKKDDFLYITGLQSGQIIFWKLIPQLNKNKNQLLKVPFLFIKYWQSDIIAIGSINHLFCSFDYKRLYYSSQNHISYLYQNKDIKMLSNHLVETDFGSLLGGAVDLDQKNEHVSSGMHSHNMGNINHLNEIINIDNNNNNKIKSIHNLTSNQDMCYVCKRKFNNQRRKRICKICNNYICSNCFVVNTLIDSNGGMEYSSVKIVTGRN